MRLRALFRRLAVPAVAGSLALTGLALPAEAADTPESEMPMVGILSPETVTVINGQSKTVKVDVWNVGADAAEDVVLNFGTVAKPVSADLGFTPPAGCTGTVCALDDLKPGERRTVKFTLKPTAPAGTSPARALQMSTTVGGVESFFTSIAVVSTSKGGADLELGEIKDLTLGRGKSADVPVTVANTGDEAVKALGLVVLPAYTGVKTLLNYRNCEIDDEFGGVLCVFNEPLPAGGTFALPKETPLRVEVASDAAGPFDYPVIVGAVGLTDTYVLEFEARNAKAKGAELKLEKLATAAADEPEAVEDLNPDDNVDDFNVSVPKSPADSAAVGGAFKGAVGDESTVEVGVRNLGPTAVIPASLAWMPYVHVRLPADVQLVDVDKRCLPGTSPEDAVYDEFLFSTSRDWVCLDFVDLGNGDKSLYSFTAEIGEGDHKAGKVTVDGGVQDSKSGNDKAALTVELTAGGSGGGLPITGAPVGLVAGGGMALLVAGLLAYWMARRRRIVTVVE